MLQSTPVGARQSGATDRQLSRHTSCRSICRKLAGLVGFKKNHCIDGRYSRSDVGIYAEKVILNIWITTFIGELAALLKTAVDADNKQ
jgi:hypothetical protein